ncbi:MAG: hypothetical protein GWN16_05440, partial [Calditrichae bacterium]|nr:hypothetical protein [Calditrichia bacterium]
LWFLLLWFQDILHIQKTQIDEHHLRNTDKAETLQKFFSFSPRANVEAIVFDIEAALQHLADQRNFNPLLILTNLAIKLNLLLKG